MELFDLTALELGAKIQAGEISAVEAARACLERIKKLEPVVHAFVTVTPEAALARAEEVQKKIDAGELKHPLAGVPMAIKDLISTKGVRTTCASKMLENYVPVFDATVVQKLDAIGAVCLGKTNMDEFAMGSSTESSYFGVTRNPWDASRVPGGSSGGSSSAVAAGLAPIVTGTDTGGSIREPASFTGVTGMKPTYGRPSRLGMIAFASSLDTAGLLGHSAEDCAWVLGSMVGFDPKDSTSVNMPTEDFKRHLNDGVAGLRIGVPRKWLGEGLDPELRTSIEEAIETYRRLGAEIVDIELPMAELGVPVYYVVACAEASSNLSRFDGVRYGHRAADYTDIVDMIKNGEVAMVINTVAQMLWSAGPVGIVAAILVLLAGHYFNIIINVLGAFVHSSRLQYIEFFGKFYEAGGRAFLPLALRTKYTDITK